MHNLRTTVRPNYARTFDPNGLDGDQMRIAAPSIFAEEPHHTRSEKYKWLPTVDVMRMLYKEGFRPMEVQQSKTRIADKREYTKHLVKMRHVSNTEKLKNVGDVTPEILLRNSHDGTSTWELMSGIFRLVCTNGLVVTDGNATRASVPHRGDATADKVIEASYTVMEETVRRIDWVDALKKINLDYYQMLEYATAAQAIRFDEHIKMASPVAILAPRRNEDKQQNLWNVFNRAQENMIRGGLTVYNPHNRQRRRSHSREITGIDDNIRINSELWNLTLEKAKVWA